MTLISFEARLRKIEARRARATAPLLTKQQRDACTAFAAALPGAEARSLAALATEPNAMIRDRAAATITAFWRADA